MELSLGFDNILDIRVYIRATIEIPARGWKKEIESFKFAVKVR